MDGARVSGLVQRQTDILDGTRRRPSAATPSGRELSRRDGDAPDECEGGAELDERIVEGLESLEKSRRGPPPSLPQPGA